MFPTSARFVLFCTLQGKGGVAKMGILMFTAAEERLLLWVQKCVFCANSELLLKYRGERYFCPIILIDISVADFSAKANIGKTIVKPKITNVTDLK